LIRPSAIRRWWGASSAIVLPAAGGLWVATWGTAEDEPDYITAATIQHFEPARRLALGNYRYHAKSGALPFQAELITEFLIRPSGALTELQVTQAGFPAGPEADAHLQACKDGWRATFAGIRRYLAEQASSSAQP
jgi:uncharacterized protein YndB with AHSA1/START domain